MIFVSFSIEKILSPAITVPVLSHITSCTPLHLIHTSLILWLLSLSGSGLYRLLTFQVPNLMSLFRSLGRTKVSVQVRGFLCQYFVIKYALSWGVVSTSPNPQAGGQPLVGCLRLLIQRIRSILHTGGRSSIRNSRARHSVVTGTCFSRNFMCFLGKFWVLNFNSNGTVK